MTVSEILALTDHTLLKQDATEEALLAHCRAGLEARVASVCIPPRFVRLCADFLGERLPVCTVIGFPLGYQTLRAKAAETEEALQNGAREIDVVIPVGEVKGGHLDRVSEELVTLKALCQDRILKVIVETCLLNDEEKIALCRLVSESGADFIKTSTGFSTGGATVHDVALFKSTCPSLRIKASGGIRTLEFAEQLICAGASRIGASALVSLSR